MGVTDWILLALLGAWLVPAIAFGVVIGWIYFCDATEEKGYCPSLGWMEGVFGGLFFGWFMGVTWPFWMAWTGWEKWRDRRYG